MAETNTAPPDGYKTTEIGPLPEEWEVVRLVDVAQLRSEGMHPEAAPRMPYVGLEHIDPGNNRLRRHGRASEVKSNKSRFFPDDVLYGKLRPYLDKAVLARQEGMCSTDILVFAPVTNVVPAFLSHLLHSKTFIDHAVATTTGVNHPRTSWSSLREHLVALPPLPEQQAIASVLHTVQRAKETTEQVIASARELKKGLMRHLFTYGPVPVEEAERVPLKETEIGPAPEHWEIAKLGEVILTGPQNGIYKPQSAYGEGTPIIRIDDFGNEGGTITFTPNRLRLSPAEIERYQLNPRDILLNRVNSLSHLGKSVLVGAFAQPTVFESNMMRFGVDVKSAAPEYLSRFLSSSAAREQMRGKAKRAVAQSSINQGDVKSIIFPLPLLSEQREIAHILSTVDEKIATEENRKRSLEVLFKTLLHNLMTGKLRVEDAAEVAP